MPDHKFLIVEDEMLISLQLKRSLIRAGYEVCGAVGSGEQAIATARQCSPDVILMDIGLLGAMDGIEAARQITAFLPVVLIFTTGYPDQALRERAAALNPAGYLIKPVYIEQIQKILRSRAG